MHVFWPPVKGEWIKTQRGHRGRAEGWPSYMSKRGGKTRRKRGGPAVAWQPATSTGTGNESWSLHGAPQQKSQVLALETASLCCSSWDELKWGVFCKMLLNSRVYDSVKIWKSFFHSSHLGKKWVTLTQLFPKMLIKTLFHLGIKEFRCCSSACLLTGKALSQQILQNVTKSNCIYKQFLEIWPSCKKSILHRSI